MSELLKPCPFCGSTDIAANSFAIEASVRCLDCCAVLVRTHPRNTDGGLAAVIEAWNTRADLSDALLREAMDVMERTRISMCEGFCRDLPTFATHERSMDNDCAVCHLRPTIAKMKECFPNGI